MSSNYATLDGNWEIVGLPSDYIVAIFMMSQIENYVTGTIEVSNDVTQNFGIEGNNNYPNVSLDFKVGSYTEFNFQGTFKDTNTVTGTLSGRFTGPATLSRSIYT
jgi:hypothetical protein